MSSSKWWQFCLGLSQWMKLPAMTKSLTKLDVCTFHYYFKSLTAFPINSSQNQLELGDWPFHALLSVLTTEFMLASTKPKLFLSYVTLKINQNVTKKIGNFQVAPSGNLWLET